MAHEAVAPYVSSGVDAADELRQLGNSDARYFLHFLQTVAAGRRKWRTDAVFLQHGGLRSFKAEHGESFILYVVEVERDGSVLVTLMHAGRMDAFAPNPNHPTVWNAAAVAAARAFLLPRLKDFLR